MQILCLQCKRREEEDKAAWSCMKGSQRCTELALEDFVDTSAAKSFLNQSFDKTLNNIIELKTTLLG